MRLVIAPITRQPTQGRARLIIVARCRTGQFDTKVMLAKVVAAPYPDAPAHDESAGEATALLVGPSAIRTTPTLARTSILAGNSGPWCRRIYSRRKISFFRTLREYLPASGSQAGVLSRKSATRVGSKSGNPAKSPMKSIDNDRCGIHGRLGLHHRVNTPPCPHSV